MDKAEFLDELRRRLSGLPQFDLEERLEFYAEMIDDRMEDGLSEAEAVAGIGSVDAVAEQIMADIPLTRLVKEKAKRVRRLRAWEIVLLVLGSPVWLPVLAAGGAVCLSLYLALWAVLLSFWAADLAFVLGALGGVVGAVLSGLRGSLAAAALMLGAAFVCAGLALVAFAAFLALTKGLLRLTKKLLLGVKRLFIGKEAA